MRSGMKLLGDYWVYVIDRFSNPDGFPSILILSHVDHQMYISRLVDPGIGRTRHLKAPSSPTIATSNLTTRAAHLNLLILSSFPPLHHISFHKTEVISTSQTSLSNIATCYYCY